MFFFGKSYDVYDVNMQEKREERGQLRERADMERKKPFMALHIAAKSLATSVSSLSKPRTPRPAAVQIQSQNLCGGRELDAYIVYDQRYVTCYLQDREKRLSTTGCSSYSKH
ncbi:hypothetical protein F2P81_012232 [Scophthalmus maximus]|uniref:Uncharacterized protein n=1 Tax=Scophthalmus maximus TaxID=52904 RepID=A0A6A4STV5_SCOMX|nr:hypothetical protein F2P81_012232 [Scophthalmus maximus]